MNMQKELSFTQAQIQPKNLWYKFLSLSFFKAKNLPEQTTEPSLEEREIQKKLFTEKMTKVLDSRMFDVFFQACQKGYLPNEEQKVIVHDIVTNLMANENYKAIDDLIAHGLQLTPRMVSRMLFYGPTQHYFNHTFFQEQQTLKNAPLFSEQVRQITQTQEFRRLFTYDWLDYFEAIERMDYNEHKNMAELVFFKIYTPLGQFFDFFEMEDTENNFNFYLKTMASWRETEKNKGNRIQYAMNTNIHIHKDNKKYIEQFNINLKKLEQKLWENKKHSLIHEAQNLYSAELLNNTLISQTQEYSKSLSILQLPIEAQDVLNKINLTYQSLLKQDTKDYEAERLGSHHVSQIIGKYLRIDKDYRDTLRNEQGQSPKDIMMETLSNILHKLEEKRLFANENHLHDMNAIKRYSNKI